VAQAGFEGGLEALADALGTFTWADTEQGRGLAGTTIRTATPYIAQNVLVDPNLSPWRKHAIQFGYASAAAFPLSVDGKAIGALSIYSNEPDAFDAEELELLTEAAQDLAFGVATLRTREEYEQALKRLAYFDSLTGLPNHAHFEQSLRRSLLEAGRAGQSLALLMIDLTRLREINDALGFQQGDELLREVSLRICHVLKREDLVARMRGDGFAVLLSASDSANAADVALQILDSLGRPFAINGLRLDINATVGISLFPQHGAEATHLIRHADVAMHQAKKSGKAYVIYNAERDEDSPRRLAMAGELRSAIEKNEFVLHYQPKVDTSDDRVCGVEALVRWEHPQQGMIPPDEFISLAEQTGLIKPLTEWVMETALRQSIAWRKAGLVVPIAVNLSARNLRDAELVDKLEQMLSASGAEGNWLELEITEGAVMEDPESALVILKRLSDIGISLFIDDFGTGYSSLSYLKKLPVDAVKIDKSFVIDMLMNTDSAAIVRSTIGLAHDLGLKVVAEGVENRAVWDRLIDLDCDVVQGYHISRPLSAEQLIEFVLAWQRGRLGSS
jgi:diguanylate cyclase (GGDEF)-like protein